MKLCLYALCLVLVEFQDASAQPTPTEVRASFLKMLDRPKTPPDVKVVKTTPQADGWELEEFTYASEKKADGTIERVPVIMLRPMKTTRKLPAVIVLHGTGGNMQGS